MPLHRFWDVRALSEKEIIQGAVLDSVRVVIT